MSEIIEASERVLELPALSQQVRVSLHDQFVQALSFAPNGGTLAALGVEGELLIIAADGREVYRGVAHTQGGCALSWHSSGERFATSGQDGMVKIWNSHSGVCEREFRFDATAKRSVWVEQLSFSPRGDYLIAAAGKKLIVRNGITGEQLASPVDHAGVISALVWHPEGTLFSAASYGTLNLYEVGRIDPVAHFEWRGSILTLQWSPCGRFIAAGNHDASVHFWIVASGRDFEMRGYPTKVRELSWRQDTHYLATGGGSWVTLWDFSGKGPAGRKPITLEGHQQNVSAVSFQHKGELLASVCKEGTVLLWRPKKNKPPQAMGTLESGGTAIAWDLDDARFAVGGEGGEVVIFGVVVA